MTTIMGLPPLGYWVGGTIAPRPLSRLGTDSSSRAMRPDRLSANGAVKNGDFTLQDHSSLVLRDDGVGGRFVRRNREALKQEEKG
ncbi:MAG: hypothetical protein ABFS37_12615 [Acidobacteriota bacterium]